jgi:hypothetical protein
MGRRSNAAPQKVAPRARASFHNVSKSRDRANPPLILIGATVVDKITLEHFR